MSLLESADDGTCLEESLRGPGLITPLRHPGFAFLWAGQSLSAVGNAASGIALAWLVFELTGSSAEMGIVIALRYAPMLVLSLFGGVAADRLPRRTVVLASDLLCFLLIVSITLLIGSGEIRLWQVYLLSLATGAASAFFLPASSSIVPDLVPRDELIAANSLKATTTWAAGIVGPAIGAGLVSVGGLALAFAFDAVTFAFSALCLLGVPSLRGRPNESHPASIWDEIAEGIRTVGATPWLWVSIVVFGLIGALDEGAWSVVLPKMVVQQYGAGVEGLGLIRAILAGGLMAGAIFMGQRSMPRMRGIWLYGATVSAGLALAAMAVTESLYAAAFLAGIAGAFWGVVLAIWATSIQDLVPQHLRGRVRSIDFLGSYALLPVGTLASGLVSDAAGPTVVFLIGGLGTAMLAACALLVRDVRTFGSEGEAAR